jgi:N-acyl-D-aspartate/D-glutamate deacylase
MAILPVMPDDPPLDVILENGLFFDGSGSRPGVITNVGIRAGRVVAIDAGRLPRGPETRVYDARGKWVMPGFVDLHTHYDAEVEVAPGLAESVRHGVTTVLLGSCSLSLAVGTPEDLADMFCRVEAVPDEIVRPLLAAKKTWSTHAEYFRHLDGLALGPNVVSFVGHSAVRAHVMGIERSLDDQVVPTEDELRAMEALLEDALDEGYLGLSIQTLPWDKMGGDRSFRSRPLPSTFARYGEYRRLARILRRRGRIFQGVPNVSTKWNVVFFLFESVGLLRRTLKTTVISMMDLRKQRWLRPIIGTISRVFNTVLGADFRWQALPEPFDLWADGVDLVVFEELGAGAAALHYRSHEDRVKLFADPAYRTRFKAEWKSRFLPKVFHRDFDLAEVLACPDASLVGRTFADIARERGHDAVDTFLDLVTEHGTALRWYTVMANDRERPLQAVVSHPDVLIGFSDAGAHLRNMAHYNFSLRMLRLVNEAARRGEPFMPLERAVWRLTGELADWLGIEAGHLAIGSRADVVVVDPAGLTAQLDVAAEAAMPEFDGLVRLVRRNDSAISLVLVNGHEAVQAGVPTEALGQVPMGTVLRTRVT